MFIKKYICILLVVIMLTFSACSLQQAVSPSSSQTPTVSDTTQPEATPTIAPTEKPTVAPTDEPKGDFKGEVPTGEGMIKAYESYKSFVDFWYGGGNYNSAVDAQNVIDYNGQQYCKYEDVSIKSLADLKSAALEIMSEELWSNLQKSVEYIDKDGELYGPIAYGNGADPAFAGNESDYTQISDTEYELKVATYYYATAFDSDADPEKKILVYETTCKYSLINERWIFTSVVVKNSAQG